MSLREVDRSEHVYRAFGIEIANLCKSPSITVSLLVVKGYTAAILAIARTEPLYSVLARETL